MGTWAAPVRAGRCEAGGGFGNLRSCAYRFVGMRVKMHFALHRCTCAQVSEAKKLCADGAAVVAFPGGPGWKLRSSAGRCPTSCSIGDS